MLRIAIITDIHHGKDATAKKGSHALRLLSAFEAFVEAVKPDVVLELGDRISDEDRETDLRLEQEVNDAFSRIRKNAPVMHFNGNHDRDFLSAADNEAILGQPLQNSILDLNGWRIVLFRADTRMRRPNGFHCPDSDIEWLAVTLASADRPVLVASHVPLSGHGQDGNYYFGNTPGYSRYPETQRLRTALAACAQPVCCVSGHVHWNTVTTVDGIAHLTLQSLTESFTTSSLTGKGTPCGSWGMLKLDAETVSWKVHGQDQLELAMPVKQLARRWYKALPPLEALADENGRQARIEAFDRAETDANRSVDA